MLQGRQLHLSYHRRPVVEDVSIRLVPGEVTVLIGPNGSGKSTLLRALARLHRPDSGELSFDGDTAPLSPREFATRVSLLGQHRPVPSGVSAREVIEYGRHPYRSRWRQDDPDGPRAIARAIEVTGVGPLLDRSVEELSGGELQRVWLAACLAQDTGVLLLDEPTSFLDLRYQVEILELIRDLAHRDGVAVGLVLHDLNQAAEVADRIVLLHKGRIRASGPPAEALTEAALTETYGIRIHVSERHPMIRVRSLAAAAAVLALGACGSTEEPTTPAGPTSAGPVTVTDSRGKAITLKAPATRVVSLEWGETEMLLTLGVQPVGAADVKGYATWVSAAKLDPGVKDVGTRSEPSVDSIVALQPDLVVMEAERDAPLVGQLEKYVPVIVTKGSDASRNLDRMREDFRLIATAVGRTAKAEEALSTFDKAIADAKARIAAAGNAGKAFAVADGWMQGSAVSIRMFGQGALVSQVAIQAGLTNAWTGEVDAAWGLGVTDVEGLTALKDKDLRFFYNASDGTDVFADGLKNNAIWTSLPFVQKGQLYRQPDGIWTFGGPLSLQQFLDQLVKAYG